MAIELPDLPYAPSALAPHLSATTLELHHDGHHRAHVEEVNRLLPGSGLEGLGLEDIVRRARGELFLIHQTIVVAIVKHFRNSESILTHTGDRRVFSAL